MITALRVSLFIVDLFVALAAIGGGIALFAGLESSDRVPPEWLHGTPFQSYVVPGLILAVIVGGSAAIATFATYESPSAGGAVSLLASVLLMGFIVVEVAILNQPSRWTGTEVVFFITGLVMSLLGLVVLKA
ncbi:MAG: hypothetical protein M5U01_01045 [Ardenticatenaceae bacterium]|nr:hypothetical protein [Ardenticatenaceae bacterium]